MKFFAATLLAFSLLIAGGASAQTITITDTTQFLANGTNDPGDMDSFGGTYVNMLEGFGDHVSWTHQFSFDPPAANIVSAFLTLNLRDDGSDPWYAPLEFAFGLAESGQWALGVVNTGAYNYGVNVSYLADGAFGVSLYDVAGDFYIDSSVLNITYNTASVPEPASILLLGCGLVGLGVFGRKRR